jgi:hypothetical protein
MLEDLRKYSNLGTPNYFFDLLNTLKKTRETNWEISDVEKLYYNRVVDGRNIYDGCIDLGLKIEVLVLEGKIITLNKSIAGFLKSIDQFSDKFIEYLFHSLAEDEDFLNIFSSENLTYDIIYKSLQISNSAFGLKFSNFKQLLIDFGAIKAHPSLHINCYLINSRHKKLFDKTILPEIKKRKIGIEEFKRAMELQQIYGEEAEKFVLAFEKKRLEGKPVEWIAEYIVNEGYDIASYNEMNDMRYNRFIEVKSYDGPKPYFYWSRNEYTVAKRKKQEYWLYLVNRSEMNDENYKPLMLQDPFNGILKNDDWDKQVDKYIIKFISQR